MTVREMLQQLSELPLDMEMYFEFDEGTYVQHFPLELAATSFHSQCGLFFYSPQLNGTIKEDFKPREEF